MPDVAETVRCIGEGEVSLTDRAGLTVPARWVADEIRAAPNSTHCNIRIRVWWPDTEIEGIGADAFAALMRGREQLETRGLVPVCYGASRRAILTGMARDMGNGRQVYLTELGRPVPRSQLVKLMASGDDVEPATIAEQAQYHHQFWASLSESRARRFSRRRPRYWFLVTSRSQRGRCC